MEGHKWIQTIPKNKENANQCSPKAPSGTDLSHRAVLADTRMEGTVRIAGDLTNQRNVL